MFFIRIFFLFFLNLSFFPSLERNTCFSDKNPLILSYCLGTSSSQRFSGLEDSSKGKDPLDSLRTQAFNTGHWVDIKALIVKYPDSLNDTDGEGNTLLHLSIQQKNFDAIEYLLEQKTINLNLQNNNQETPLLLLYQLRIKKISNKNFFQLLWYWISPSGRKDRKSIDTFIMNIRSKNGLMNRTKREEEFEICVSLKGLLQRHLIKKIQDELRSMSDSDEAKKDFARSVPSDREEMTTPYDAETNALDYELRSMSDSDEAKKDFVRAVPSDIKEMTTPYHEETNYLHFENNSNIDEKDFHKNSSLDSPITVEDLVKQKKWDLMENIDRSLLEVISEGNLNVLKYLLEQYSLKFSQPYEPSTELFELGIKEDKVDMIEFFITNSHINFDRIQTFFNLALQLKRIDIVDSFVEKKIFNIAEVDQDGEWMVNKAVIAGDVNLVKYLLEKDVVFLGRDTNDKALLHQVVQQQNLEMVKYLLQNKLVDINELNEESNTALYEAIILEDIGIINCFVQEGILLNPVNAKTTPLNQAIQVNNLSLVKYLIRKGAHVNLQNDSPDIEQPLHQAIEKKNVRIVDHLLNNGANINGKSLLNQLPLTHALITEDTEIIELLIKHGASLKYLPPEHSWFHYARNMEMLMYFLTHGANINATDTEGNTPLHWVSRYGNKEMLTSLLNQGEATAVHVKNKKGETPLHWVSRSKDIEMLTSLLDQGGATAVHVEDAEGDTPLHWVSEYGTVDMLQHLLNNGADMKVKNKKGQTPLYFAIRGKNFELIDLFQSVHMNVRDDLQRSPLDWAYHLGQFDIVKYLIEKKGCDAMEDIATSLFWVISGGTVEILSYVLTKYQKEYAQQYELRRDLLNSAIRKNNLEMIQYFMTHTNTNIKFDTIQECFDFAIQLKRRDIVYYFVKNFEIKLNDVPQKTQSDSSESYLHWVYKKKDYDLLKYFLENGADMDIKGSSGSTVLDLAKNDTNEDALKVLNAFIQQRDAQKSA